MRLVDLPRERHAVGEARVGLWIVRRPEEAGPLIEDARAACTPEEVERFEVRALRRQDRMRWTMSRGLLRFILGAELGCSPRAVPLRTSDRGKPVLDPGGPGFSVSHPPGLLAAGVVRRGDLGLDAENAARRGKGWESLMEAFTPDERAAVRASADPRSAFFRLWTLKEAAGKAVGEGLSRGLNRFVFSEFARETFRDHGMAFRHLRLEPDACLSLAYRPRSC